MESLHFDVCFCGMQIFNHIVTKNSNANNYVICIIYPLETNENHYKYSIRWHDIISNIIHCLHVVWCCKYIRVCVLERPTYGTRKKQQPM